MPPKLHQLRPSPTGLRSTVSAAQPQPNGLAMARLPPTRATRQHTMTRYERNIGCRSGGFTQCRNSRRSMNV